ncbi:MAG: hypothetical protein ACI8TP_005001 [Acidimicrobiales bacterium]|jgi:hypothetical protein
MWCSRTPVLGHKCRGALRQREDGAGVGQALKFSVGPIELK